MRRGPILNAELNHAIGTMGRGDLMIVPQTARTIVKFKG